MSTRTPLPTVNERDTENVSDRDVLGICPGRVSPAACRSTTAALAVRGRQPAARWKSWAGGRHRGAAGPDRFLEAAALLLLACGPGLCISVYAGVLFASKACKFRPDLLVS